MELRVNRVVKDIGVRVRFDMIVIGDLYRHGMYADFYWHHEEEDCAVLLFSHEYQKCLACVIEAARICKLQVYIKSAPRGVENDDFGEVEIRDPERSK